MARIELDFHSDVLGHAASAVVILPQTATTQIGMAANREEKRLKTLWLLHGLSDDHTIWSRRTSVERYAANYGIAVVMPNGGRSWYTDMVHGEAYYTFMTEELPAVCRSFFLGMSDRREDNFIAGLSMGGYGALKIALRNPDRYAAVASFSGALDIAANSRIVTQPHYWSDIFGDLDKINGSDNDVYALAEKTDPAAAPNIYLSCGTEDWLIDDNRRMRDLLAARGIACTYSERPGIHNWEFWDVEIQEALRFFFAK